MGYAYQLGDSNADGRRNQRDLTALQNCLFQLAHSGGYPSFDFDGNLGDDGTDYAAWYELTSK